MLDYVSTSMPPPGGPQPQRPQYPGPQQQPGQGYPPPYQGPPPQPGQPPYGGPQQPPTGAYRPGPPPGIPPGPFGFPGPDPEGKPRGRKGLVAAVIVLSVLVLGLGGTTAYLWFTGPGASPSDDPVSLPASLSGFNSLTGDDTTLVRDRTIDSYSKAFGGAPADIREYAKGSGDDKESLTAVVVRDSLERPVVWAQKSDPDASKVTEPKPGTWCLEYRISKDDEYETSYCIKSSPELSVSVSYYSSNQKVTPAELSDVADQAWSAANGS